MLLTEWTMKEDWRQVRQAVQSREVSRIEDNKSMSVL